MATYPYVPPTFSNVIFNFFKTYIPPTSPFLTHFPFLGNATLTTMKFGAAQAGISMSFTGLRINQG